MSVLLPTIVWEGCIAVPLGVCAQNSLLREQQVEDNLRVESPVTGVVEHEYSIESKGLGGVGEIDGTGERSSGLVIVVRKDLVERPDGGVFHEDVAWSYNSFEAVPRRQC